ncbi:glycosyltransferase family 2 protein [Halobium salinum]|uniref:Glycosyltransferase family 2 protein n=1 Tax=Halobium salinum TaxID=1364940 RepID=A0ABD5PAT3_9EURY|nr:glycosyltransferase family 2 protein [Halobium salinum]
MYDGKTIGVVVKAYNEEGFVGGVIDTLPAYVDRAYVIDDRSEDGTWDEIVDHANRENERRRADGTAAFDPVVEPIRHERNRGVGGGLKTGYRRALEDGLDVVVCVDGDGQMNPERMPLLIEAVTTGGADYAKGNRLTDKSDRGRMSTWRWFGNSLLTNLTRLSTGYWSVTDSQNGYTAINRETLEALPVEDLYERYGVLNDVLAKLNVDGRVVADVRMPAEYGNEQSGIRYGSFVPNLSKLLLRNFVYRQRRKSASLLPHPSALGYALGVLGGVAAVVGAVRSVANREFDAGVPKLVVASLVSLLAGLLFDVGTGDAERTTVEREPADLTTPADAAAAADAASVRSFDADPDSEPAVAEADGGEPMDIRHDGGREEP